MGRAVLDKQLINYLFENNTGSKLVDEVTRLVSRDQGAFNIGVAEALADAIENSQATDDDLLSRWAGSLSDPAPMLSRFLYIRSATSKGRYGEAIDNLTDMVNSLPEPEPFLILHLVRNLVRDRQMSSAADYLKLALFLYPPYPFYIKCEQLLRKIVASGNWSARRRLKIALLGSSTTTFLSPVLQACCFRDGISAEMYQGQYGAYQQEILHPGSGLYLFAPDVVILLPNYRDLSLSPNAEAQIPRIFSRNLQDLWMTVQRRSSCHVIQIGFDLPPDGPWGNLEDSLAGGRAKVVRTINGMLSDNLPSGVSFLDPSRVALRMGDKFVSDVDWYTAKQYPSLEALPLFSDYLCAHVRAAFGLSAKVLVLDLDNTLWGGVIGEDGVSGIVLGPPSPEGEAYIELQRYIKELKGRGILIAVCSKNNPSDAELPFDAHDSMVLTKNDFVIFTANWQDKATNIEEMARSLSLGLDSFVFLDDNPLERGWVRSRLPQVIVPECGSKPWEMLAALRRGMYFESIALTAEDLERHNSYKANVARQELEHSVATLDDFLVHLEMVAESGPVDAATLVRATQLINKTNQFNLTGRRYSEEQVKAMAESCDWWTRWFRLKDKFGDYGLIGVILVRKDEGKWCVDSWLMSCRALGRNMEEFMASELLGAAARDEAFEVIGEYVPTAKNSVVKGMYARLGFGQDGEPNYYSFKVRDEAIPECKFIHHGNRSSE